MDNKRNKIKKIFALLFVDLNLKKSRLQQLGIQWEEIKEEFFQYLEPLGMTVTETDKKIELVLDRESSSFIVDIQKREYKKDLTETALQILTLVLYCGPISKTDIDYIRGVNSATSLRKLLSRSLVEKNTNGPGVFYTVSNSFLADYGIENTEMLSKKDEFCKNIQEVLSLRYAEQDENQ